MKKFLLLSVVLGITGCVINDMPVSAKRIDTNNPQFSSALNNFESRLKDSDSAKYKNELEYLGEDGSKGYCFQVNSKNSYGGYTGFEWFTMNAEGGASGGDIGKMYCEAAFEKLSHTN